MTYSKIIDEWDSIANDRFLAFENKTDKSYEDVLKPRVLEMLKDNDLSNVLDVGCGVGALTFEVANFSGKITGIDISSTSIEIAKKQNKAKNIEYKVLHAEELSNKEEYSLVYSNMVLMNMPDICDALNSIHCSMIPNAKFIFTITHPSFWPIYWKYFTDHKFKYNQPLEIKREFRTQNQKYEGKKTRHFHRPIEYYINNLTSSGFRIINLYELSDESEEFWYPRFMMIEVEKSEPNTVYAKWTR